MSPTFTPGLVSVVVPVYNRAELVAETLDSVAAQTYRPIELLVIDDGSTDDTPATVQRWQQGVQDTRFSVVTLRRQNGGPAAARNSGLLACHGEFVQFMDSDDLMRADKIAIQVARLRVHDADVTYAYTARFTSRADWSAPPYVTFPAAGGQPLAAFLHGGCWPAPSALFRRRLCAALGPWDERAPILEDWDYGVRLLLSEARTDFLDEVLLLYRQDLDARPTVTARAMRPASLRGRYELVLSWLPWVRDAGLLDQDVEAWFAEQLLAIALMCLSVGQTADARHVLRTLKSSGLSHTRTRRGEAVLLALAALPRPCSVPLLRGANLGLEARDAWSRRRAARGPERPVSAC
jgi:hypothetical protein